jgi:hypothetical protein
MEAPQNRRFCGKIECLPFWPTCISEKGRTLGKTYGTKARCYWEQHWRTHWELEGNKEKMKKSSSPPPLKLNRKKIKALCVHASLPIGCMKFLCPILFITIFGLG